MPLQTLNTATADTDLVLGGNVTTGDVTLGANITSGEIIIGDSSSTGAVNIRGGSGTIRIGTNSTGVCNIMTNSTNTNTITIGTHARAGNIALQTGGDVYIGTECDDIFLGGSEPGSVTYIRGEKVDIGDTVTTQDLVIGSAMTSGDLLIGEQSGTVHTGDILIGSGQTNGNVILGSNAHSGTGITSVRGSIVNLGTTTTAGRVNIGTGLTTGTVFVGTATSSTTLNGGVLLGTSADVTQLVSSTDPVTANGTSGKITTFTLTNAGHSGFSFVFNNTSITTSSKIYFTSLYSANFAAPLVITTAINAGNCTIRVFNASNVAYGGPVIIHYLIL